MQPGLRVLFLTAIQLNFRPNEEITRRRHCSNELTRPLLSVGQETDPVGLEGVCDPHLLAVDDEVVPDPPGGGLAGGHVTAAAGLTDSQAGHNLQQRDVSQPRARTSTVKV